MVKSTEIEGNGYDVIDRWRTCLFLWI